MKKIGIAGAAALTALLSGWTAQGEPVAPDAAKLGEYGEIATSLTGAAGDAKQGREWFANRKLGNCLACHVNSDMSEQSWHGEVGPPMDGVADRYSEAELRGIVANSKSVFGEQTIMPAFYSMKVGVRVADKFAGKTILSAQQVEDIVAYLMTLKEQ